MGKTEKLLLVVAVVAGGYWLYQRSQQQAVAPAGNPTPNDPTKPSSGNPDYLGAAGTVWDGAKKVGGAIEDAWDRIWG